MLAFSSGELIQTSSFARSLDVSQPKIKNYMELQKGLSCGAKCSATHKIQKKRLVKTPKGHLRDTLITNYLLNINSVDDLLSHPQFGRI